MALLPVDEAQSRLLTGAAPLGIETVPLVDADGRVLARPIAALRTQPPFAASAMDGYAVRADDTTDPTREIAVIGAVAAGSVFDGAIAAGEALRIFTGAPVPEGADAILIQEDAEAAGDNHIRATAPVEAGRHIRAAGIDFRAGAELLQAGRMLDAGALSLAAAGNHAALPVFRRPIVGVMANGDELVAPGSATGPGQIVAANSAGIASIVRAAGGMVVDLGIAGDNAPSLNAHLDAAHEVQCDVLVALGGASVGDHDLVRPVFEARGMALDFWRIAMRPGKPMMFGRLGAMRVVGLPGNPVSSLVCCHLFVAPLVARLAGRQHAPVTARARLADALPANGPREHYMRAHLGRDADGGLHARAFDNQDSSLLHVYAQAHGLIVRPPDTPDMPAGAQVAVIVLRPPDAL